MIGYTTAALFTIAGFSLGWCLGRALLTKWFHRELDKLQATPKEHFVKSAAYTKKTLELIDKVQAMVQNSGKAK